MPGPHGWQQSDVTEHPNWKNGKQGNVVVVVATGHGPAQQVTSPLALRQRHSCVQTPLTHRSRLQGLLSLQSASV